MNDYIQDLNLFHSVAKPLSSTYWLEGFVVPIFRVKPIWQYRIKKNVISEILNFIWIKLFLEFCLNFIYGTPSSNMISDLCQEIVVSSILTGCLLLPGLCHK